jgi:DNA-binding MarR family transcriptional regulator
MPHNQAAALVIIWGFKGQITPTILSHYLSLERHSVSELISRMEAKGFVRKQRDKNDKKSVKITITEKGKDLCTRAMDIDFIRSIMSTLSKEQRDQLQESLQILLEKARKDLGINNVTPLPF